MINKQYMKIAIGLALRGAGNTSPNPMVGALIIKNNKVIGKGYHKKIGENHAEIEAINHSAGKSKNAILYITLEPCNHKGKTPPCTEKIINNEIKHVIFAIKDPNLNVKGNGENRLNKEGIKVSINICRKEALFLNENFIKYSTTGLPFVITKCASTLDGRIATYTGNSKWITELKARNFTHKIRHNIDAILVGINTVLKDNPKLTARFKNKVGFDPIRIILDTKLSIKNNSKIISQKSYSKTYIFTKNNINNNKKNLITNSNIKIIPSKTIKKKIFIPNIIKKIGENNLNSLLIEGGSEIIGTALSSGVVDKILFFYAPKILASTLGLPICKGPKKKLISNCINLNELSFWKLGPDFLIEGYLKNK